MSFTTRFIFETISEQLKLTNIPSLLSDNLKYVYSCLKCIFSNSCTDFNSIITQSFTSMSNLYEVSKSFPLYSIGMDI